MEKSKIFTICGSMQFAKEQMQIAEELELKENICVIQCIYNCEKAFTKGNNKNYTKQEEYTLDKLHKQKIDISDGIYVVNIGGYVGSSKRSEINYAKEKNKEIIYHEEWLDIFDDKMNHKV